MPHATASAFGSSPIEIEKPLPLLLPETCRSSERLNHGDIVTDEAVAIAPKWSSAPVSLLAGLPYEPRALGTCAPYW